jgi:Arabinose efflux permease
MSSTVSVSRWSVAIAALSTIVEWYDFTLYLYFATVLARVFFGGGNDSLGITLAGFAVSWLLRPLGALFFGRMGDRYGRRRMMLVSMAMMTGTLLLTAILPGREDAGTVSGILLLLLRSVMAFSVGGEYTGVVAYLLESAPVHRRGLMTSLASAASEVGALLAVGMSALTVYLLSPASLDAWGWRIPFVVGFVLAAVLWLARTRLEESPEFVRQRSDVAPLSLWASLACFRKAIARSFAISALGSVTYYLGITYVPAFLVSTGLFPEQKALLLSVIAALLVVVVSPLVGALSDRMGRKPVLLFLTLSALVVPVVVFCLIGRGDYLLSLVGGMVLACLAGAVSAVGAVSTAELFPVQGRLAGLALGATAATTLFGGLTPYLAHTLVTITGNYLVPGVIISIVALCVLPVLLLMPETAPQSTAKSAAADNVCSQNNG